MKANYNPYHDELGRFTTQLGEKISEPKKKSKKLWSELLKDPDENKNNIKSKNLDKRLDNLVKMTKNQDLEESA